MSDQVPPELQRDDWKAGDAVKIQTPYTHPNVSCYDGMLGVVARATTEEDGFDLEEVGPYWLVRLSNGDEFHFGPEELTGA